LYLDGILQDRLSRLLKNPRLIVTILRELAPEEKCSLLMKDLYGFTLSEICQEEARDLPTIRRERNDIVHRWTFSKRATAVKKKRG
jgi:DNA-directed RNA polymerase specialized sigma24 family protein